MSSQYPSPYNWKMILLSQVSMLAFSYVLSLYPQYFLPIYIVYMIVMFGVMSYFMYRSNPMLRERVSLREIANARVIYEEKKAKELMEKDTEYLKYMTEVSMKTMRMLLYMIVYLIAIWILYYTFLLKYIGTFKAGIDKFIVYVVFFEALYVFNVLVYSRMMKPVQISVMAPTGYKITEKGILGDGGVFLHSKYLLNANIDVNREKKYVEISSGESKLPFKIRLYTDDVDKLLAYIERLKKLEAKRQSSNSEV
ncbi:MAG: DUF2208 domain-containing protein [Sulfolobaceae archaeon]|nr:DUF2208 domain-containing protein [Sulfolobaceae archaeon]